MLEVLSAFVAAAPLHQQRNVLREYLQWLVLQALDDAGYRRHLAFTGGLTPSSCASVDCFIL